MCKYQVLLRKLNSIFRLSRKLIFILYADYIDVKQLCINNSCRVMTQRKAIICQHILTSSKQITHTNLRTFGWQINMIYDPATKNLFI